MGVYLCEYTENNVRAFFSLVKGKAEIGYEFREGVSSEQQRGVSRDLHKTFDHMGADTASGEIACPKCWKLFNKIRDEALDSSLAESTEEV
jgi:hypothetical protein